MIELFKKWLGEILIDIGRKLVVSSDRDQYIRYGRGRSRNKYNW